MPINNIYVIVILALLCFSSNAFGDNAFRCGTRLVTVEDTREDVIYKCGEPTSVDSWEEERIQRDFRSYQEYDPRTDRYQWYREPFLVNVKVKIELWTYNLGSTQLIRYLRFENGAIKEITTGSRGY